MSEVERVPYETTWIPLGERWSVDTDAAFERIAEHGRGGYCFHLNGSLRKLLSMLGYDVSMHVGGVHRVEPAIDDLTNHLVLVVGGLPTADNPDGNWYVDAGLGDALYEPLPLRDGTYEQEPMTFELTATPGGIGDWHFTHDPSGSFASMSFLLRRAPRRIREHARGTLYVARLWFRTGRDRREALCRQYLLAAGADVRTARPRGSDNSHRDGAR